VPLGDEPAEKPFRLVIRKPAKLSNLISPNRTMASDILQHHLLLLERFEFGLSHITTARPKTSVHGRTQGISSAAFDSVCLDESGLYKPLQNTTSRGSISLDATRYIVHLAPPLLAEKGNRQEGINR
jgi:hypothetical protein